MITRRPQPPLTLRDDRAVDDAEAELIDLVLQRLGDGVVELVVGGEVGRFVGQVDEAPGSLAVEAVASAMVKPTVMMTPAARLDEAVDIGSVVVGDCDARNRTDIPNWAAASSAPCQAAGPR
ncbi:MAG: hypothetical protein WBM50_10155 [Acidimicrobiales bacterium]